MTTKTDHTQPQMEDETLDAGIQAATGELSDAQLERVAAGSSPTIRGPNLTGKDGIKFGG